MSTDEKATAPTIERIEISETVKVVQSNMSYTVVCSIMCYASHIVTSVLVKFAVASFASKYIYLFNFEADVITLGGGG